jgi:hypothetical protein
MLDAFSCMNFKLELDVHCQKDKRQFFANERQRKKEAIFFYRIFNVLLICAKKQKKIYSIFNVLLQSTTNSPKY